MNETIEDILKKIEEATVRACAQVLNKIQAIIDELITISAYHQKTPTHYDSNHEKFHSDSIYYKQTEIITFGLTTIHVQLMNLRHGRSPA